MFPKKDFLVKFHEIKEENNPKIFKQDSESVDKTPIIVLLSLLMMSIVLGAVIGIFMNTC